MKNQRPVWFSPLSISMPVGAVVSLLHRLSGVLLFLSLPFFLYLLQESLASAERFAALATRFEGVVTPTLVLMGVALAHHVLAGIRLMLMDTDIGKALSSARHSAKAVLVAVFLLSVAWGVWLC